MSERKRIEIDRIEVAGYETNPAHTDDPHAILKDTITVMTRLHTAAMDGSAPDHAMARLLSERMLRYAQNALATLDETDLSGPGEIGV